ncbi:GNAT family N-acetyltransferase [Paramagnetospirillum magneticum]|uniref:Histone acetyltransferase HPA2 and related acetyltransferase n=1 Tax=Paramagnetospirillum magneticum (strain ATCC 700264 / AMB-1) TaxID=342108 RepID=Q2W0W1_PARM1|nr:GNAT family N-acetyltransferase [Paramagnetospirillum magneticum]BAE52514.1 Histone acetyltransferase HPA2 and related acetyltransferase [Paramagnetospirillum magneticum AMB-1]
MLIRRLYTHERAAYADHLKRLSPDDRRLRFARSGVADQVIDDYVAAIGIDDLILAAFADDQLVGAAHVALNGSLAEVGVSVDQDHRTDGIGSKLLRQAASFARNRRAEKLYTLCLSDNRSMVALARRSGMQVHFEGGEAEAFLDLPPPDPLTVTEEINTGLFAVFHDWAEMMDSYSAMLVGGSAVEPLLEATGLAKTA